MKYCAIIMACAVMVGCTKELDADSSEGRLCETTVSVSLDNMGLTCRAATADADVAAADDMNVTLVVSSGGKVVYTATQTGQDLKEQRLVRFPTQLEAGLTYDISAWADFGKGYYSLPEVGDAPVVAMTVTDFKSSTTDREEFMKMDGYYATQQLCVTSPLDGVELTLRRPFALVKIYSTDWDEPAVRASQLHPERYATTFTVPTCLNLATGEATDMREVKVDAAVMASADDSRGQCLSFDYLLAPADKSIMPDFTVDYSSADGRLITSHTFTGIPYRRNWKTNISGQLLTASASVHVMLDSNWNGDVDADPDAD